MPGIPAITEFVKADTVTNATESQRIQALARSLQDAPGQGGAMPAMGSRPLPGALPTPDFGDSDPLKFQLQYGTNLNYTPRAGYGLTPFQTLRALAAISPEVYACIQTRKDQLASLSFDYAARDKTKRNTPETDAKITKAREFLAKPDHVTPFATWLQLLIDEVLTIDALSIYRRKTRVGTPYGYEIIDGATIKVLLNPRGQVPLPPDVAYRQIIYGAPMQGGDMTTDQLMYLVRNPRVWTPYGMSPTEAVLMIVSAALNRTMYNLSYYVKGNIPEALVGVPDTWSPKQISQFMEYWNIVLRGDPSNRAGLRFVTETMAKNVHEFRDADFTTTWELWLLKVICACFAVTPTEIGFTDDVNKATSQGQGEVNLRRGIKPMANFIKTILDTILVELGLSDLETTYSGGEGEHALQQAQIREIQLRTGEKSLDEVRSANGDPLVGAGPAIITTNGPIFWKDVVDEKVGAVADAKSTAALVAATPAPGTEEAGAIDDKKDLSSQGAQDDLKKYLRVAKRDVALGQPIRKFASAHIPERTLGKLAIALQGARSADDVTKAFGLVMKAQRLNAAQKKSSDQMKSRVTQVLSDMADALVTHMEGA